MFTLTRSLPVRELVLQQAPALLLALVIAELFYKFHSFLLECGAFLVTWYVIDAVISFARNFLTKRSQDASKN